jgi:hypothetical protein
MVLGNWGTSVKLHFKEHLLISLDDGCQAYTVDRGRPTIYKYKEIGGLKVEN